MRDCRGVKQWGMEQIWEEGSGGLYGEGEEDCAICSDLSNRNTCS